MPPCRLNGYVFAGPTGALLARLDPIDVVPEKGHVNVSFALPSELPDGRLCLVIEGLWNHGAAAGCETSFEVSP